MLKPSVPLLLWASVTALVAEAQEVLEIERGEAVERHLPGDPAPERWALDPGVLDTELGDRLEQRDVPLEKLETVKLANVVPPIRFGSGVADIPPSYIERLRDILDSMRHLEHVRLHVVGHADDQPLSDALAGTYGDNAGLSRERAGEVAEFIQTALALPPDAISFEWAGDTLPIATNATREGRALNRRVEVEVWYDKITETVGVEEVVVPQEFKRVKVCRIQTVCKLRYRDGHSRRARVKNLVEPLHFSEQTVDVPDEFIRQIEQALTNLRAKQNVVLKLIGFTDDAPLTGTSERIYGTHLALSKARAYRVARAIQEALELPSAAIASDGQGGTRPIASNETARGRALNRRIEVEFWHDDPLQELPDEPQLCPDAADAEVQTKVYDPPWGRIPSLQIVEGEPVIPPGYTEKLRHALADVSDKTNARLRFVGYTKNERIERRTAMVYGDDIGLSVARAGRAMEQIKAELGLSDAQVEHEGRGYVHSTDVVNGGFVQGTTSHVVVEVVYDELALVDDYEGIEITPITRELRSKNPLELNLMRITVDGKPIDDPGRSSADIQRCTDVALDNADIQFHFDSLAFDRRLSVTSEPGTVPLPSSDGDATSVVRFRMYTNYAHFIERSEIRILGQNQSVQGEPIEVIKVGSNGMAHWRADPPARSRGLKYVLRAYDNEGRFDETAPQPLWLAYEEGLGQGGVADFDGNPGGVAKEPVGARHDPLLAGYGESGPLLTNIPLGDVGTVKVHGSGIPRGHTVWLGGSPVPVDESGKFVADVILPSGTHTVEVAVLDPVGNGELFLRDLELEEQDWFYVGMADLTMSQSRTSGPADALSGENSSTDYDSLADGRLAFYVNGKFGEDWKLTASADTREGPVEELFTNFMEKSPESLLRRMDPDYHYPTFGDDGTVQETAPTSGKFYVKLNKRENHALWGNFKVGYGNNELARVERGLYGGNVHLQSLGTTEFGEKRLEIDTFAADPGTVSGRDEFRGTGGSLYFLRRQDLLTGSEQIRIELRDKDTGLVSGVVHLQPQLDYDIDYLQGRILLSEPLASTANGELLVRNEGLSGDEAWLVVQYEYTPGLDEIDTLATGGQGHYWLNDAIKVGLTASRNDEDGSDSSLYGADLTVRKSAASWLKLQAGQSQGLVASSSLSQDGGFQFIEPQNLGSSSTDAHAYRADVSLGFSDFLDSGRGRLNLYLQQTEAGYSAPGESALTDTRQFGGTYRLPFNERLEVSAKADRLVQDEGLETTAQEVDVNYQLTDRWTVSSGIRNEDREDNSPSVPATQQEGRRTDSVVQLAYDSKAKWRTYGFAQATLTKSGDMEDNRRAGIGGAYRVTDRLSFDGEASHGDLGPAAKLGTIFQQSDRTRLYFNYALDNERTASGLHGRQRNLISGARMRLWDNASVFLENRYQRTDSTNGLTRAMGMNLTPTDRWSLGANWEFGTLLDRQTDAEIKRRAGGARLGYHFDKILISSGFEYRFDDTENQLDGTWSERTTWLFRNNLKFQMTPDWRLVGKFNHSFSESSLGDFYGGGFTEAVLGYAYRPVRHDRLDAFAKYTYFYNVPTTDQISPQNISAQFLQKSHIASLDLTYDLTKFWSVGGKYAYRLGEVSLDRENPEFFDNSAHLFILRNDLRFLKDWEASVEGRLLDLRDVDERRTGALLALYRYVGNHLKVGVGYNFTDFSEDLTDLSYKHHGWFLNVVGSF